LTAQFLLPIRTEKRTVPAVHRHQPEDTLFMITSTPPSATPDARADRLLQALQRLHQHTARLERSSRDLSKRLSRLHRRLVAAWQRQSALATTLRSTLDGLTVGVIAADASGAVLACNREAERLTGQRAATMQGTSVMAVLATAFGAIEGLRLPIERPYRLEHSTMADERPLHLNLSLSPLPAPNGERAGTIIMLQDVTPVKQWQGQRQRTQCLSAMGEMATRLAEEMRHALGSMELFAALLQQELDHDPELLALVAHVLSGVKSLNQTLANVLLFTRCPLPRLAPIDPHALLEASLAHAGHLIRHRHLRVDKRFTAPGVAIHADAALLKQAFLNLILNAIQAMPQGGTLVLATHAQPDMLGIEVRDTGTGIAPEAIERIFTPFFTTKEGASGLGLTLVHNIVEAHHGTVQVFSRLGRGTTVALCLPRRPATPDSSQETTAQR
jgi:PAS domain S-box-containing protein